MSFILSSRFLTSGLQACLVCLSVGVGRLTFAQCVPEDIRVRFYDYMEAANQRKFQHTSRFETDTVWIWETRKEGSGYAQNRADAWSLWDSVMQSNIKIVGFHFDPAKRLITARVLETNLFYKALGLKERFYTLTYELSQDCRIQSVVFIADSLEMDIGERLKPFVAQLSKSDPGLLKQLYPDNMLMPSVENALAWLMVFKKLKAL